MSARSLGTHLSLSPMSTTQQKRGATAMVTPPNINYVPLGP